MKAYDIVYEGGVGEIAEKKSRFIATVFPVQSEEEAQNYIEETKKKYWDARHNCHAFIIGKQGEITRCSDDGEPSGTAGRPILEVLTGADVHNVLVIVTRYFGGTLLGTGGLVRAYSQATQAGLAASQILTRQPGRQMSILTDYNGVGKMQYIAAQNDISILDTLYAENVEMKWLVPLEKCDKLIKEVTNATAGQAQIDQSDPLYFAMMDGKPLVWEEEQKDGDQ